MLLPEQAYLQDSLNEMNRRLRRRMATRGEISLDVEDNLGPYDWPEMKDLTLDMLRYSIHFPLLPNVSLHGMTLADEKSWSA